MLNMKSQGFGAGKDLLVSNGTRTRVASVLYTTLTGLTRYQGCENVGSLGMRKIPPIEGDAESLNPLVVIGTDETEVFEGYRKGTA